MNIYDKACVVLIDSVYQEERGKTGREYKNEWLAQGFVKWEKPLPPYAGYPQFCQFEDPKTGQRYSLEVMSGGGLY